MTIKKRRQLLVDGKVQGVLLRRVAIYWGYCLISVTLMLTCWMIIFDRPNSSAELFHRLYASLGPALVASVLLVPMVIVDCMRLSNRFAGPLFRMRRAMRDLANGIAVAPIHFRDGDFWFDFAEDFNRVAALVSSGQSHNDEQPNLISGATTPGEADVKSGYSG